MVKLSGGKSWIFVWGPLCDYLEATNGFSVLLM